MMADSKTERPPAESFDASESCLRQVEDILGNNEAAGFAAQQTVLVEGQTVCSEHVKLVVNSDRQLCTQRVLAAALDRIERKVCRKLNDLNAAYLSLHERVMRLEGSRGGLKWFAERFAVPIMVAVIVALLVAHLQTGAP
jgi:hypothetical protein